MAAADLDTIASIQQAATQYLGLIVKALQQGQVNWQPVPATSGDAGTPGMIAYDSSYLYLCVAANSWRRIALSTF